MLMWTQVAPAFATASTPDCCRLTMGKQPDCCAQMPCCAAKQSAPAESTPTPAPSANDTQLSVLAPTISWVLPANEQKTFSSITLPPTDAADMPLYARHCALLL